ncbi:MAG: bifunctional 2-polyprenyl-6-hydroxyphenol methylase/3-demethylubiquinol 3-O-methyltransferase UbiG [Gammaproteobacteria bacterium]|nr:bifunctional 2-polyprenyl-6-hydroxyphenol methylase/3-demethylubiquinol 3-O-methyltransferase UbiG [Gammaproteobacteria bacterium]MCH9717999.1 bifunctional 2-polyprenyl-6-hydroxyphenol methylase/3-demethylubiquinol 3-O-methyltransferase UbiG [Gammaproteobacteria bacterium]MCH9763532.1 bifunctional 2-polyprenyl-6-hydroxyphenol methylase/3-demethylubiquinol 3-O-methyltransferase UbiG [Gammaproteobacteria bacterium]
MTTKETTVDPSEIARFATHATRWWDKEGPLKTLHDINPVRLDWIQQCMTLSGARVLDIGCGGGILSEGLAKAGAEVTGLDVEEGAIHTARLHAVNEKLKINYVCEPVEHFDAPLFDAVTCLEMLEHVEHPEAVIQAASRLVKPGGYVFLSTINRTARAYASAIVAAEYILSLLPRKTHTFERFIRPSELAGAARHEGLEVIDITGLTYNPLTRQATLKTKAVDVNYLMATQKLE